MLNEKLLEENPEVTELLQLIQEVDNQTYDKLTKNSQTDEIDSRSIKS